MIIIIFGVNVATIASMDMFVQNELGVKVYIQRGINLVRVATIGRILASPKKITKPLNAVRVAYELDAHRIHHAPSISFNAPGWPLDYSKSINNV